MTLSVFAQFELTHETDENGSSEVITMYPDDDSDTQTEWISAKRSHIIPLDESR